MNLTCTLSLYTAGLAITPHLTLNSKKYYGCKQRGALGNETDGDNYRRSACSEVLSKQLDAVQAVELSISALEDDDCLNAGFGSNLTIDGQVECDASVMDDQGGFGSVGAVSGSPLHLSTPPRV